MRVICSVFASRRKEEMYLYVPKQEGLKRVPAELLERFGTPRHVMDLLLTPERQLARIRTETVLAALADQGFYLQLPPPPATNLLQEHRALQQRDAADG